jgi:hypothetical protein
MRGVALALAAALLLGGCTSRPARHDRSGEVSYNRRELPPSPGLFTGEDGVWTVYRNDVVRAPEPPPPRRRTTLSCEEGHVCDPPQGERREER